MKEKLRDAYLDGSQKQRTDEDEERGMRAVQQRLTTTRGRKRGKGRKESEDNEFTEALVSSYQIGGGSGRWVVQLYSIS